MLQNQKLHALFCMFLGKISQDLSLQKGELVFSSIDHKRCANMVMKLPCDAKTIYNELVDRYCSKLCFVEMKDLIFKQGTEISYPVRTEYLACQNAPAEIKAYLASKKRDEAFKVYEKAEETLKNVTFLHHREFNQAVDAWNKARKAYEEAEKAWTEAILT